VLLTLFGRLAQFALMFASVRIMTELLSPAEMGKAVLLTTATAFFALLLVNPVGMYFNRRLHAWMDAGRTRERFHTYLFYLLAVCVVAALSLGLADQWGLDLGGVSLPWVLSLICGSLFFNTCVQTLVPSLNMVGRHRAFIALTLGHLAAGLVASIVLNRIAPPSAERWLLGALLGQVVFSGVAYGVFFRPGSRVTAAPAGPSPFHRDKLWQMAMFCWPIALAVLLQWLHMQGYRFVLAQAFGLTELGLYAAGYGVAASLMAAADTILTTWFQPRFYRMVNSDSAAERDGAWRAYAQVMVPASLLAVTATVAAAPSLPRILLGASFHDTTLFVVLGALAEWTRMLVGVFGLNAHRHMATHKLLLPSLLGALLTYAVLWLCMPRLGIASAALGVWVGSMLSLFYLYGVTYADDPHMRIDFRALALPATVLVGVAVLLAWVQQVLLDLSQPGMPYGVCLVVGLVWLLLGWRTQGQAFVTSFRQRQT